MKTKILAIDIGTGTQDILLFDARLDLENALQLVMPSPTMVIRRRIQAATQSGNGILLDGVTMGGGPCAWAAEDHLKAGYRVFATPEAAKTFNDDLTAVAEMGIQIVAPDEALRLPASVQRITLSDVDLPALERAFAAFDVQLDDLAAVALAVFDHGAAPPDISDRQFRFDYLDQRIRADNRLETFAFLSGDIPPIMTRLQSAALSAAALQTPLVVMDTAPAAVLGATFDPAVRVLPQALIANVGNFHTLAFKLGQQGIEGVFEHHTGLINRARLEGLLEALANGTLMHTDVFNDHGHGALVYSGAPLDLRGTPGSLVVCGPRRSMLRGSQFQPYFAVPFGDMMLTGCYGLLAGTAARLPELHDLIWYALRSDGAAGRPPWEI